MEPSDRNPWQPVAKGRPQEWLKQAKTVAVADRHLPRTHHDSAEGSVQQLLEVAKPRWGIISNGSNGFRHPRPEALTRLEQIGATIWCTDTNGRITARIPAKGTLTWRASLQHARGGQAATTNRTAPASDVELGACRLVDPQPVKRLL